MVVARRSWLGSNNDTSDGDSTMGATDGTTTSITTIDTYNIAGATKDTITDDTHTVTLNTLFADAHDVANVRLYGMRTGDARCAAQVCACADCGAKQNAPCVTYLLAMHQDDRPGSQSIGDLGRSAVPVPANILCMPDPFLKDTNKVAMKKSQAGRISVDDTDITHDIIGYANHYDTHPRHMSATCKWYNHSRHNTMQIHWSLISKVVQAHT